MKTTNWQAKVLTLFIAAAALWLATACTAKSNDTEINISPALCVSDSPQEISKEFKEYVGRDYLYYSISSDAKDRATRLRAERLKPETERIQAILDRYIDFINSHPNKDIAKYILRYRVISIDNGRGLPLDEQVISIDYSEELNQALPLSEYRVPKCIEGVSVYSVRWSATTSP